MQTSASKQQAEPQVGSKPDYDQFKRYLLSKGLMRSTTSSYSSWLKSIHNLIGTDPMNLSPEDCQALKETDGWLKKAKRTKRLYQSALKQYWMMTKRYDLINGTENQDFWVLGRVKAPTVDDIRELTMPEHRVKQIVNHCEDVLQNGKSTRDKYRGFLAWVICNYGIRAIGATSMRVCDIDLDDQTVNIPKTKGNKKRRIVMDVDAIDVFKPFLEARRKILRQIQKRHPHLKDRVQEYINDVRTPLFFVRTNTRDSNLLDPLTAQGVKSIFRNLTGEVFGKGNECGPHSARHAKVFRLIEVEGWSLPNVKTYMGHESIDTTMRYAPIGLEEQRREVEKRTNPIIDGERTDRAQKKAEIMRAYEAGVLTDKELITKLKESGFL